MSKFDKIIQDITEAKDLERVKVRVDPNTKDNFENADEYSGYILAEEPVNFYERAIDYMERLNEGVGGMSLFPGGFKPPHISHYNEALDAAQQNDIVCILIDSSEIDGITADQSKAIWEVYKPHIGNNLSVITCENIYDTVRDIIKSLNSDSVDTEDIAARDVIDQVKGRNLVNITLHTNDDKFKKLAIHAGNNISNVLLNDVNVQANSQLMRYALKKNDEETFKDNLPNVLGDSEKQNIWNILKNAK